MMGLLKHVALPLNALLNLAFVVKILFMDAFDDVRADWGASNQDLIPMEHHLWHCLGGTVLCNTISCVVAIYAGNSLHRMMICANQALFFIVDGWSYFKFGVYTPPLLYIVVGINIAALVAHSQEPGLFTKDKNDIETKKK